MLLSWLAVVVLLMTLSCRVKPLLEASLGLQFNHAQKEIRFENPVLPPFVDRVHLQSLRLGSSKVDILLRRHASDVAVNVTTRSGDAKIIVVN